MHFISYEEHEKNLKNFETEKWHNLNYEERLDALQKLENRMAQEQGRDARKIEPVEPENLEKDTAGEFDSRYPSYININKDYLRSAHDFSGSNYDAMDTIIHEGRHAYQYDVTHGKEKEVNDLPDNETVKQWKENNIVKHYSCENPIKYRFQSKEDDAYNFAHDKMKSYEGVFRNDPRYQKYIKKESRDRKDNELKAKRQIGENFKGKINGEIANKCNEFEKPSQDISTPDPMSERLKDIEALQNKIDFLKKGYDEQPIDRAKAQLGEAIQIQEKDLQEMKESFKRDFEKEPMTARDITNNICELQGEYISTTKQLTEVKQDYSSQHQKMQFLKYRADKMEHDLDDINSKESRPDKQKQAIDYFKKTHQIEPEKAASEIKELREQAAAKERELKPTAEKVKGMSQERDKILQDYKDRIGRMAAQTDGQAVLARFELSRKSKNIDPRDIKELKEIERSVADSKTKGNHSKEYDRLY